MEELEAVDWYQQRIDAADDGELKRRSSVTTATRRRSTPRWCSSGFAAATRASTRSCARILFTERPITALEPSAPTGNVPARRGRRERADRERRIAARSPLMDILRREQRPAVGRGCGSELDEAAASAARNVMTARRIATFDGPRGWDYIAAPLGTDEGRARPARERRVVCVPEIASSPSLLCRNAWRADGDPGRGLRAGRLSSDGGDETWKLLLIVLLVLFVLGGGGWGYSRWRR